MARSIIRTERKVTSLLENIEKMIGEGSLSLPALTSGVTNLTTELLEPVLTIEIVCLTDVNSLAVSSAYNWLGFTEKPSGEPPFDFEIPGLNCKVSVSKFEQVHSNQIGALKPCIRIFALNAADQIADDWKEKIMALGMETSFAFLLTCEPVKETATLEKELKEMLLFFDHIDVTKEGVPDFRSRAANADFQSALSSLFNFNATLSLESLKDIVKLGIEQEKRSLRAKQAMNKKQVMKVQSSKGPTSNEIQTEIKKIVSTQGKSVMKGLDELLEKNTLAKTSPFIISITEISEELEALAEEKKSKEMVYKIPEEFDQQLLQHIRTHLVKTGQEQLIMMHDAFRSIEQEINVALEKEGIPPPALNFKYLTDQKLKEILDNSVHWEKPYEGAAPKKGAYEYFMAVRKYQMFVFLIASTFGLSFRSNLKIYMIPLTFLLMGVGGFAVYNSVRKERKEKNEKELEKARIAMMAEAKRIASDFVKQWQKIMRDHLEVQENSNQSEIEYYLKNYFQSKKVSEDDEKNQVQRQSQALDNFDRKFQGMIRFEEDLGRNIDRLKSDLRISFRDNIRKIKA